MNNASGENICYKNVSSLTHTLHLIRCGQILALTTGIAKRGEKESRSLALREPFPAPKAILEVLKSQPLSQIVPNANSSLRDFLTLGKTHYLLPASTEAAVPGPSKNQPVHRTPQLLTVYAPGKTKGNRESWCRKS